MKEYKIKPKDTIYELIRSKIINKELFPNSQIVESQLAFETGISRTPIREALKRLDYEGIVNIIPNRGAYISNPTLDEIKAVYECKNVLEMAAIKEACFNISDEDLRLLDELIISDIKAHEKKDFKSFIEINGNFHMTIVKASKNVFFEKYIHELLERSNVYLIFFDRFMFTPGR